MISAPILRDEEIGVIDLVDLKRRVLGSTRSMVESDSIKDVLVLKHIRMGG